MVEGRTLSDTIEALAREDAKRSRVFGLRGGAAAYFVSRFAGEHPRPSLIVAASLADAEKLGGRVVMPRTELPEVTIGVFEDPEGHAIGLLEARQA